MKKTKTQYEAQALAIVMVVMVISSIIGMSIYFRSMQDKTLTLEERASAEALEISDLILDQLTQFPVDEVILAVLGEGLQQTPDDYVTGINPPLKENEQDEDITELFEALGLEESIRNLSICPVSRGNEYQVTIKEADEDTYYEIKPGQTWSLPIKGLDFSGCNMSLKFAIRGESRAGFVLTKSYAQTYSTTPGFAQSYKNYDFDDITSYCFGDGACNASNFENNWQVYNVYDEEEVTVDLAEVVDGYNLDEVRIKAVGGTIGLNYTITPNTCFDEKNIRLISVRATANCDGIYRGKEILIPETKWHNTLFDYAVFNAEGTI